MNIFYAVLTERAMWDAAVASQALVHYYSGQMGYRLIQHPYARTDVVRSHIARHFLNNTKDPDDVLVMLDCDHNHPFDIVGRLAAHGKPVVGALSFKRGADCAPLFYYRDHTMKQWLTPESWKPNELLRVDAVGSGAIAIQRHVFNGMDYPYFKYYYPAIDEFPTEDFYFALECERLGIPMYVDTGTVIPHYIAYGVTEKDFRERFSRDDKEVRLATAEEKRRIKSSARKRK